MKKMNLVAAMAVLAMSITLTGCSGGSADLEAKVKTLEAENAALKEQLAKVDPAAAEGEKTVVTGPSPQAFKDVGTDVPSAPLINDLAQLKVFGDAPSAEFKPLEPVKRGEYIVWLYNAYNATHPADKTIRMAPGYKVTYADLAQTHPSYKYVQALSNAGYAVGYDAKSFKPDQAITREEMLAIKHGVDGAEFYTTTSLPFTDAAKVDKKFVDALYSESVIFNDDGPKGGNIMRAFGPLKALKPKEPVLRYEAAATLWQTDHRGNFTADAALGRKPAQ